MISKKNIEIDFNKKVDQKGFHLRKCIEEKKFLKRF